MFLEVYAIPTSQYTERGAVFEVEENKRLIEMTGIRIRRSSRFVDRAEIVLMDNTIVHVAGSLEELSKRIARVTEIAFV